MTSSINKRILKYLHKHCLNGDKIDGLQFVIVKKSEFLKEQEAKGLLSGLGLRTSLYQILFLGPLLIYTLNYVLNLCLKCI